MYLDQRGQVRACCQNDYHLLGNVTERPLLDIWRGEKARELREAMARQDLDLGCDFCEWQVAKGRPDLAFARWFDQFPVESDEPPWPQQLELAVSNTCNLQCVMCDGEWSSSIRSQREGLPPLPKAYDDAFFEGLVPFLPHLRRVKFLGGEPFLAAETLRVMDLLVDQGLRTECHVTTNGTQWSPRVERILDRLPVGVSVSIDAATAATYESIRVGSSWDTLMANLDRFQERADAKGTYLGLTFCLMVANWHEFFDFCLLADRRGLEGAVNTVRHPHHLSLYMLDADALAEVVSALDATDRDRSDELTGSRTVWDRELARLRAQLVDRRSGASVPGVDTWRDNPDMVRPFNHDDDDVATPGATSVPVAVGPRPDPGDAEQRRRAAVGDHPARLRLDRTGVILSGEGLEQALGVPAADVIGAEGRALAEILGRSIQLAGEPAVQATAGDDTTLRIAAADGDDLMVFTTPAAADERHGTGTWVFLARCSRC
jgi:MoaA/NifB/PqqE/SkfB family radical SAM enzyme